MKIFIGTTVDRPREYTEDIKNNLVADLKATVEIINLEDIVFSTVGGNISLSHDATNLKDFDLFYIKHWHSLEEAALVISNVFERNKIIIPEEVDSIVSKTKFGDTFLLSLGKLPVPDSIFCKNNEWYLKNYDVIVETIGTPFIFKSVSGKKGSDNYLVKSKRELLKALDNETQGFIAQKFIPNDCDYRLINFGNEIKTIIKRTRTDDSHMNNTSQGGEGESIDIEDLDDVMIGDSLRAAKLLKRNISGVDLVIDKNTGKHYFMEINYSPQLTTGFSTEEKRNALSEYLKSLESMN